MPCDGNCGFSRTLRSVALQRLAPSVPLWYGIAGDDCVRHPAKLAVPFHALQAHSAPASAGHLETRLIAGSSESMSQRRIDNVSSCGKDLIDRESSETSNKYLMLDVFLFLEM